jgi:hypothetical protein
VEPTAATVAREPTWPVLSKATRAVAETTGREMLIPAHRVFGELLSERLETRPGQVVAIVKGGLEWLRDKLAQPPAAGKEQPWVKDDPDYMELSDAIPRLADGGISLKRLGSILKPDGPMRYMRRGRRCKVHIGDFRTWWKTKDKGDAEAERLLAEVDKRKAAERQRRMQGGK